MLSLTDSEAVSSTLADGDLDLNLRALLGFRAWDMCVHHEAVLGTDVQMFVVQGGDTPEVINDALGFIALAVVLRGARRRSARRRRATAHQSDGLK